MPTQTIKQRVKAILETNPDARSDNNKLFMLFIFHYMHKEEITNLSAYEFINAIFWHDAIPSAETVMRTARRVKQQHPELRGIKKSHVVEKKPIFNVKNRD